MKQSYIARGSIVIEAPAARVWEALTNPQLVRQYFFGTELSADWSVGGALRYRGRWEGKSYEDKGTVLAFEPEKLLRTTHFSPMSGLEDRPENYHTVTYELSQNGGKTRLTVTQDNNESPQSADHSAKNWAMVLEALKRLLEE
jgi:uncharacterized protein YndB with AHSA1/START domain